MSNRIRCKGKKHLVRRLRGFTQRRRGSQEVIAAQRISADPLIRLRRAGDARTTARGLWRGRPAGLAAAKPQHLVVAGQRHTIFAGDQRKTVRVSVYFRGSPPCFSQQVRRVISEWWQHEEKLRPPYLFRHIPSRNFPQTPQPKRHNIKNRHAAVWNSFGIVIFGTRCCSRRRNRILIL